MIRLPHFFLVALCLFTCTAHADDAATLLAASASGDRAKVAAMLAKGVDANVRDELRNTSLHRAARGGHRDIVELLLAKGADVDASGEHGSSPLHHAAFHGHPAVVMVLLAKRPGVNSLDNRRETALHRAVLGGNVDVVKLILAKGADVTIASSDDNTALHLAARYGHAEIAKLLLAQGANVNARNLQKETPLALAIMGSRAEVASLLLARGGIIVPPRDCPSEFAVLETRYVTSLNTAAIYGEEAKRSREAFARFCYHNRILDRNLVNVLAEFDRIIAADDGKCKHSAGWVDFRKGINETLVDLRVTQSKVCK